jgi:hypothetical protein
MIIMLLAFGVVLARKVRDFQGQDKSQGVDDDTADR